MVLAVVEGLVARNLEAAPGLADMLGGFVIVVVANWGLVDLE